MIEHIISLIAPHTCLICKQEGALICKTCRIALPSAPSQCYRCGVISEQNKTCSRCRRQSPLDSVHVATSYEGASKDLLWQLKFNRARQAARTAADLMNNMMPRLPDSTLLVHVPTATARVRLRGYDQAALISRSFAAHRGLPWAGVLARITNDRQVGARRHVRIQQMQNAYRVVLPHMVQNRHVVLVDDVITTGSSLESAAQVLIAAGARSISAVVFARANTTKV